MVGLYFSWDYCDIGQYFVLIMREKITSKIIEYQLLLAEHYPWRNYGSVG